MRPGSRAVSRRVRASSTILFCLSLEVGSPTVAPRGKLVAAARGTFTVPVMGGRFMMLVVGSP